MRRGPGRHRLHDAWWTLILFAVIGVAVLVTAVSFTGSLRSTVPVTLTADRSGLVMDSGAKVMMRGVQVGRVAQIGRIEWAQNGASLRLEIDPTRSGTSRPMSRHRSAPPPHSVPSSSTW